MSPEEIEHIKRIAEVCIRDHELKKLKKELEDEANAAPNDVYVMSGIGIFFVGVILGVAIKTIVGGC